MYFFRNLVSLYTRNSSLSNLHKPCVCIRSSLFFFSSSSEHLGPSHSVDLTNYLVQHYQFSPDTISKASFPVNYLKDLEKCISTLSFLEESGFSQTQLERVVKCIPGILSVRLDSTLKPKIEIFQELGFFPTDIAEIISAYPWILSTGVNRLRRSILAMRSVFGSNADVCKILKVCGRLLRNNLESTLPVNIEFLKSCGVSSLQIDHFILLYPRFFALKPETIKQLVRRLDDIGFNRNTKMFLYAIRVFSTITREKWELKREVFRNLGLSENDILFVFQKAPYVFTLSGRKIKEATQVVRSATKSDMRLIVKYPKLLTYSIENRIKPRIRVLEILESKNLLRKKPGLASICNVSNKQFLEKFVLPYSDEVGEMYNPYNVSQRKET
ncbi:hypothetical protein NMG60_11016823 [Bertholletia excelsa]